MQSHWDPDASPSLWLNRASRALLRRFDAALRPYGFAMGQLPVLRALSRHEALTQRALAEAARVEQSSMTEVLARMERDEVIARTPNPEDKRANLISLTRKARGRIPKAQAALMDAESVALRGLDASERAQLASLLKRVAQNLEPEEGDEP